MGEVEIEEACCVTIQGNFIILSDVGYHCVDVGLRVAEDESVVDVYDDICCFRVIDAVEEAIIEGGHLLAFGQKCPLVVKVEQSTGVGESLKGVGDTIVLCGVEAANSSDMRL